MRDTTLDQLNQLAKSDGTAVQKAFLDAMALSQTQVRSLADALATTLSAITADDSKGQALAAAALFAANVTPVVTLHIAFGGDNHSDSNLQAEADQHVTGAQAIQQVQDALAVRSSLADKADVRDAERVRAQPERHLEDRSSRAGRDHYGNHAVMVMIGKNVTPGVTAGVATAGRAGRA